MPKRSPEDAPLILWFDLETTGNRDIDRIIEFGGVLTDRDLHVLSEAEHIITPPGWPHFQVDPAVREMHDLNGLWDAVETDGITIEDADQRIAGWLREVAEEFDMGSAHIPYAGSGVGHFDRKYIRAQMPETSKRLSYWPYDVGVIRRSFRLWGIEPEDAIPHADSDHRALADAYEALRQFRVYRDLTQHTFGLISDAELEERITGMPAEEAS